MGSGRVLAMEGSSEFSGILRVLWDPQSSYRKDSITIQRIPPFRTKHRFRHLEGWERGWASSFGQRAPFGHGPHVLWLRNPGLHELHKEHFQRGPVLLLPEHLECIACGDPQELCQALETLFDLGKAGLVLG